MSAIFDFFSLKEFKKSLLDGFDQGMEGAVRKNVVISIKHPRILEPVLNVIKRIEDDAIYFRLPEAFLKNNVMKGDTIICQAFVGKYEYVLEGMISDIDVFYPTEVRVIVDKVKRFANKREAKRYNVSFPGYVKAHDAGTKNYILIKNISLSGVFGASKEQFNVNQKVVLDVSVVIEHRWPILNFHGQVVRIQPREGYYEYGIKIVEIDEVNKDLLDRLIYKLEENESFFIAECLK